MKTTHGLIEKLLLEKGILNVDFTINEKYLNPILIKAKRGLKKYLCIQRSVYVTNVGKDILFQEEFNNFYRVDPFKNAQWKKEFYTLFEWAKNKQPKFEILLGALYKRTGDIDASFTSKLIATINPDFPVIDSVVLRNLRFYDDYQKIRRVRHASDRISGINMLYGALNVEFIAFLHTKSGRNLIKRFISEYPYANITKTKMLDLILWQIR